MAAAALALVGVACKPIPYDFDGDHKGDLWWVDDVGWHDAVTGTTVPRLADPATEGGQAAAGDYDGDGTWEPAEVIKTTSTSGAGAWTGEWRTAGSAGSLWLAPPACDPPVGYPSTRRTLIPVIGDWDGDRHTDPGWFCAVTATWTLEGRAPFVLGHPWEPTQHELDVAMPAPADHDGDGRTDAIVYNPADGTWWSEGTSQPLLRSSGWGVPVPANYGPGPGDELALFSLLTGSWDIEGTTHLAGTAGEVWVPSRVDLNGDHVADRVAVAMDETTSAWSFRLPDGATTPIVGNFFSRSPFPAALPPSSALEVIVALFIERVCTSSTAGAATDCPRPVEVSDLDGDLVAEPLWASVLDGTWGDAATGTILPPLVDCEAYVGQDCIPFGGDLDGDRRWDRAAVLFPLGRWLSDDGLDVSFPPPDCPDESPGGSLIFALPVPGQYDDDPTTELGWYCPADGTWTLRDPDAAATPWTVTFGIPYPVTPAWIPPGHSTEGRWYDLPAPGDYDGDGIDELAVHRPADGTVRTSDGTVVGTDLGVGIPIPADYDGDGATDGAVWSPELEDWTIDGGTTLGPVLDVAAGESGLPGAADHDGDGAAEPSSLVMPGVSDGVVVEAFKVFGMPALPSTASVHGNAWPGSTPPWTVLLIIHATFVERACTVDALCPHDPPAAAP